MSPALRSVYVGFVAFTTTLSQPATSGPKFEVASVKASVPGPPLAGGMGARSGGGGGGGGAGGGCPLRLRIDSSRVDIGCATPVMLIGYAYRFPPGRITGPEWMMGPGSTRFDITAKIPPGVQADQVPEMLQALLAERFGLAVHLGATIQQVYGLVVAKGGIRVKRAATSADTPVSAMEPDVLPGTTGFAGEITEHTILNADGKGATSMIGSRQMGTVRETDGPDLFQRMDAPAITFEGLAELLERMMPVDAPVIDMTGLKGRYRLVLDVSMNGLPKPAKTSVGDLSPMESWRADRDEEVLKRFNEGLRRLGLQLERRKGSVESLVVDHLDKKPTGD